MPGRKTRSIAELTNRKVRRNYHTAMGQQKGHSNSSFWKMRQGSGPCREDALWNNQTQYQRADERGMELSVTNTERKSVNLQSGSLLKLTIYEESGEYKKDPFGLRGKSTRGQKSTRRISTASCSVRVGSTGFTWVRRGGKASGKRTDIIKWCRNTLRKNSDDKAIRKEKQKG